MSNRQVAFFWLCVLGSAFTFYMILYFELQCKLKCVDLGLDGVLREARCQCVAFGEPPQSPEGP